MVVGEGRKFTGALIVPSFPQLERWATKNGIKAGTHEDLLKNADVQGFYKQILDKYNQYFSHIEQIKKFELLAHEWTVSGGELSPTLKVKRKVIMQKYMDQVEKIYS
jgi:long-chain acyl-CoA synthetase